MNWNAACLLALICLFSCCVAQDDPAGTGFIGKAGSYEPADYPQDVSTTQGIATSTSSTTLEATSSTTSSTSTTSTVTSSTTSSTTIPEPGDDVRVEVIHFYVTPPCPNCVKVGLLAQETISMYYQEELSSGKLTFKKVNIRDPDAKEYLTRYAPTSSSLWIGTYVNGTFYKEQKISVWYKTSDPEEYHRYLKSFIDKRLVGDLSLGSLA